MVTPEPVRDRMVALTRSMSALMRSAKGSIDVGAGLSKGTMTANRFSPQARYDKAECSRFMPLVAFSYRKAGIQARVKPRRRAMHAKNAVRTRQHRNASLA